MYKYTFALIWKRQVMTDRRIPRRSGSNIYLFIAYHGFQIGINNVQSACVRKHNNASKVKYIFLKTWGVYKEEVHESSKQRTLCCWYGSSERTDVSVQRSRLYTRADSNE